jgi:hypothetical protein
MKLASNVTMFFENTQTGGSEVITLHNIACTTGKNSLANRLIGATKGEITYFAVGTGTGVPAAGDTTLGTEVYRKQISVRSVSGAIATFRIFFNTSEANAALKEIGLFGDAATSTADTGTLFARAAVDKTKTSSETLTIDWDVEIK